MRIEIITSRYIPGDGGKLCRYNGRHYSVFGNKISFYLHRWGRWHGNAVTEGVLLSAKLSQSPIGDSPLGEGAERNICLLKRSQKKPPTGGFCFAILRGRYRLC